jgi:nucleotide-binding universal stress UspA family protein
VDLIMNMAFRKILVPVDFSLTSRAAVEQALAFAQAFQGSLHLLNVWEVPPYLRPDLTVWSEELSASLELHLRDEAEKAMRHLMLDLGLQDRAGVGTEIRSGTPHSTIVEVAESGRFDLIVMGTHGRGVLSRVLMGSVAERVVRLAPCPVLTVHLPPSTEK